jgi:hypothetical protein
VLGSAGIDDLARDHLEVALPPVPTAHVAAIKPDHHGAGRARHGRPRRGPGGVLPHDPLADPPRPVPHRAGVPCPTERQQLGQERGDLAERGQRRIPGGHVGELRRDGTTAKVRGSEALHAFRPARTMAGADQQPPDPERHVAALVHK